MRQIVTIALTFVLLHAVNTYADNALLSQEKLTDASSLHQRAMNHLKQGDRQMAMEDLSEAIRLNSYYVQAYYVRGNLYAEVKQFDRAIEDYDRAIALNAAFAEGFHQRGLAHWSRGEFKKAIQDFDKLIALEPMNSTAYRDRGNTNRDRGDYDQAVEDYQQAMRLGQTVNDPYLLAHLLFFQGRFALSAQTLHSYLKANPGDRNAALWRYLASAKANGSSAATRELAEQSARLTDKRWPAAVMDFFLGKIGEQSMYAAAGGDDDAKSAEQNCEAHFYAAQAKLLQGTNDAAIELLQAAYQNCPRPTAFFHGANAELIRLGRQTN